ncbi:MAG TPA: hypothetical protein PLE16_00250 [Spirochaetota bacterium]|nr:hypothetical protein [Spirochaetota bacterium]HOH37400.1 hypothetical protein [Spirochaetota bacterium]HPJ13818.1 hypothetical protein [Spirochaetota bacterium]HPM33007.1 hypothetical protein [Spirochaetota bacterium]HPY03295.1 hypothetical protein [Spirochaetota bacterium]
MISFVFFAVIMTCTPGPGNISMMILGQKSGYLKSIPFLAGTAMGFAVVNIMVLSGAGIVLSSQLGLVMRIAGIIYVVYLAFKLVFSEAASDSNHSKSAFAHGLLLHPLSVKSWTMSAFAAVNFCFLTASLGGKIYFIAVFILFQVLFHSLWCFSGKKLSHLFFSGKKSFIFRLSAALLMTGSILYPVIKEIADGK